MSLSMGAGDDFKELVRSRTNIVDLVGETVTLNSQRGGRLFVGLCPFHDDHNPSFQVNPERQTYRCWVCQKGGDCFSYLMEHDNLSFFETLKVLADRAGLELPARVRQGGLDLSQKSDLYELLAWAEQEFHRFLLNAAAAEKARQYLQGRGLTPETIAKFKLGYHPDDWQWLQERGRGKFSQESMIAARLIAQRESGNGCYDYFVDRVLFPIRDERGRTVAFGGRILPGAKNDTAKYWNSPESVLFAKSRLCFGLDAARPAIRETKTVVVVEGYTDCIKAHQAGVGHVVATLGTALTESHVTMLKRLAQKLVLVYDGDEAGVRAAERALPRFLAQDVDLRILTLPRQLDPDEFLDEEGPAAFNALVDSSPEALDFQLDQLLNRHGTRTIDGRQRVLDDMLALMALSPNLGGSVRERLMLSRLQQRLGLSESDVTKRLREIRREKSDGATRRMTPQVTADETPVAQDQQQLRVAIESLQRSPQKDDLLECELLQILLTAPEYFGWILQQVGPDDFRNPALQTLFGHCIDLFENGLAPTCEHLLTRLEVVDLKGLVVWMDEQCQERDLVQKLAADAGLTAESDAAPHLLVQVVEGLKWRRERDSHEAVKARLSSQPAAQAGALSPSVLELLSRATQFHQKRSAN